MLGYPPTPKVWVNQGGGEGSPPPPHSPPNCRTPLGVTHWLAAAPVLPAPHILRLRHVSSDAIPYL